MAQAWTSTSVQVVWTFNARHRILTAAQHSWRRIRAFPCRPSPRSECLHRLIPAVTNDTRESEKQKVVVLGGGVGAMAAVFALTSPDNPRRDDYDVTVYQMGWRLGGKGASGRNARYHQRIEEHGLHIWMGWYHNAFRLLRECYDQLGRAPTEPLALWSDAFKAHRLVTLMDRHDGLWKPWHVRFPLTGDEPGGGYPSISGQVQLLLGWGRVIRSVLREKGDAGVRFLRDVLGAGSILGLASSGLPGLLLFLRATALDRTVGASRCRRVRRTAQRLRSRVHAAMGSGVYDDDDTLRRSTEMLDLVCTVVMGLIDEGVAAGTSTFNDLDEQELRGFLRKHGCRPELLDCAFLRAYYNLALAYRSGDSTDPANEDAAAGVAVNIMLRACCGYRGAFMWEMQAGMGDTIFAPFYQVLRSRGVRFEFFHTVRALRPSKDGGSVTEIHLERQVDLVHDEYQPLVDVQGLPCWPSEPLYDQIVRGDLLKAGAEGHRYDLESLESGWSPAGEVTLRKGEDFQHVILGIPAMAQSFALPLAERNASWRTMMDQVETVATQAVQLWLGPSAPDLGWQSPRDELHTPPPRTVLGAFAQPFHTWADFSHLASSEAWPDGLRPGSIAYLLGTIPAAMEEAAEASRSEGNSSYVRAASLEWLSRYARILWPALCREDGSLRWDLLVDPYERSGAERACSQYYRANTEGSERYVQHSSGTTKFRLRAGESGFRNLILAGDWIDTGICGGCVETATMSGLQAARAISGHPRVVPGESRR